MLVELFEFRRLLLLLTLPFVVLLLLLLLKLTRGDPMGLFDEFRVCRLWRVGVCGCLSVCDNGVGVATAATAVTATVDVVGKGKGMGK
jgi:hypothetical protein